MKPLLLTLCLAFATAVQAAPPAPPAAVSLEVELRQPKSHTASNTANSAFGQLWNEREFAAQRALGIKLKLLGDFDRRVTVQWVLVAKSVGRRGDTYVYGAGARAVEIERGGTEIETTSKEIAGSDRQYPIIDRRYVGGGKPHGYAVVVKQDGRVIASKESSAGLLALIDTAPKK